MIRPEDTELQNLNEWERLLDVKNETGLPGKWESIDLACPVCKKSEYVYSYEDEKTLYCLSCSYEFDTATVLDELGIVGDVHTGRDTTSFDIEEMLEDADVKAQIADLVSDDPATVNAMADRIIGNQLSLSAPDADKSKTIGQQQAENQMKNHKKNKKQKYNSYTDTSGVGFTSYKSICYHRPQHIIAAEGWGVWAGKKDDVRRSAREFDVVLNLTYTSIKEQHRIPIAALAKWQDYSCAFQEIQLDWADYGVIDLPRAFWLDLIEYVKTNKLRLLVFCQGGHGRTGTAIAILMCLSLGFTPAQAITWVRKNYCANAIETKSQEAYVEEMAREPKTDAEPDKASSSLSASAPN